MSAPKKVHENICADLCGLRYRHTVEEHEAKPKDPSDRKIHMQPVCDDKLSGEKLAWTFKPEWKRKFVDNFTDFGAMEEWKIVPGVVVECQGSHHLIIETTIPGSETKEKVVKCRKCRYTYRHKGI